MSFRRRLLAWYRENGRHELPWRQTRDPYAVLVSEVMLQQTQVDRVLPYYRSWLERWATASALAAASPADVIRAWAGLGYNRRGLNLHRAAVMVVQEFAGEVPVREDLLRRLPGIGVYTAAAVACFAGNARTAVADTNIGRVVARTQMGVATAREGPAARVLEAARSLLPARDARSFNLGLMDFGAMVCRARDPGCDDCVLKRECAWLAAGRPAGGVVRRPAPAFETTSRFARGRIVDALRAGTLMESAALAAMLPAQHASRVDEYLAGLERDGLVACYEGGWGLAGDTPGSTSIASPKL